MGENKQLAQPVLQSDLERDGSGIIPLSPESLLQEQIK